MYSTTVNSVARLVLLIVISFLFVLLKGDHQSQKSITSTSEGNTMSRGLFVVPGLGRTDRLETTIHNLKQLQEESHKFQGVIDETTSNSNSHYPTKSGIKTISRLSPSSMKTIYWDCVVYVYASRQETEFWSNTESLAFLSQYCELIENPNKRVTENMYMIQPALLQASYDYVFLLLDDIKIVQQADFQLHRMVELLHCNRLTVLSPMIVGANKGGGQKFRNIMQTPPQGSSLGYVSTFVEIFAWVMTMPGYRALWELLYPEVNPYAWGYDFWYEGYARATVPGHRMGVASVMHMKHEQDTSVNGAGRTDNTRIEDKWNAVIAQERHYLKHKQIKLAYYRKNLDISNTSWNGAVKDFIRDCKR